MVERNYSESQSKEESKEEEEILPPAHVLLNGIYFSDSKTT